MIRIGQASFGLYDGGCFTRYDDGAHYGAHPHDTDDYRLIAERLGYGSFIMKYCVEHELCHHCVSELAFGRRSAVLWPLAHGEAVNLQRAVGEEALVMTLQRWMHRDERPIIGDVHWHSLRAKAEDLLDALYAS